MEAPAGHEAVAAREEPEKSTRAVTKKAARAARTAVRPARTASDRRTLSPVARRTDRTGATRRYSGL